MMVKVLLYAYATGVFSSRRVARKLEEDVGFRVLAAGNFPQHRTLCEFRRRHLEDFQALFVEVVRLAQELGLARLGKLSIDGTKVRANASKRKAMSYELRDRGCCVRRTRLTRPRTRAWARRFGATICRGVAREKSVWRRSREARRVEAAARAGRRAGSAAGQVGTRRAVQAGDGAGREVSEQLHGPGKLGRRARDSSSATTRVTVDAEHQLVVATDLTGYCERPG